MPTPFQVTLQQLAAADPDAPALTDGAGTLSRRELDELSTRWAHGLRDRGVAQGDIVSLCLPSDRSLVVAAWAAWKVGATPQALSPRLVAHELREIVELTRPPVVVGAVDADLGVPTWDPRTATAAGAEPLPLLVAPSWKAPTSGGSTGRPKVILATSGALTEPLVALAGLVRMQADDVVLLPAPLHHNGPFLFGTAALLLGSHVVLMERFDATRCLRLAEAHRAGWFYAVPTIMNRITKLPPDELAAADLSSVQTLLHLGAPCPDWLKRWWIDWLGPDTILELYAGTEAQAVTVISGTEWLEHPGSVGRAVTGEMVVLDEAGERLPPGEVGEVFMRASSAEPTYRYLGATARTVDGWESLGDMGWMDADGYLYLSDRKTDMVLVGGVNVYPAEVEAALDAHPAVLSSCVVGLPDPDLGNRLHAVVHVSAPVAEADLQAFLAERLAPHKRPRAIEFTDEALRDDAGKMRRSAIRAARL